MWWVVEPDLPKALLTEERRSGDYRLTTQQTGTSRLRRSTTKQDFIYTTTANNIDAFKLKNTLSFTSSSVRTDFIQLFVSRKISKNLLQLSVNQAFCHVSSNLRLFCDVNARAGAF